MTVVLCGAEVLYVLKKSKRKTISAFVNKDGDLEVRTPFGVSDSYVREFLRANEKRICEMLDRHGTRTKYEETLTESRLSELRAMAEGIIPERVKYYADVMNVKPARVRINSAKTRFGSCSGKGSLNFSCRLMAYSAKAVDYVVIHELSHLIHMNHSPEFWRTVEKHMPDYKVAREELKKIPE